MKKKGWKEWIRMQTEECSIIFYDSRHRLKEIKGPYYDLSMFHSLRLNLSLSLSLSQRDVKKIYNRITSACRLHWYIDCLLNHILLTYIQYMVWLSPSNEPKSLTVTNRYLKTKAPSLSDRIFWSEWKHRDCFQAYIDRCMWKKSGSGQLLGDLVSTGNEKAESQ